MTLLPKNYPFDGDYRADLFYYLIDVDAPTNTPGPANVYQQIYAVTGDVTTAFLLWLSTPGMMANEDPGQIVLLQSISQLASWMGRPSQNGTQRHLPPQGTWFTDKLPYPTGSQGIYISSSIQ